MTRKMTSVALLSMLVLSSGTAVAKPVAQQNRVLRIADLSNFTVNPAELKLRLDRSLRRPFTPMMNRGFSMLWRVPLTVLAILVTPALLSSGLSRCRRPTVMNTLSRQHW